MITTYNPGFELPNSLLTESRFHELGNGYGDGDYHGDGLGSGVGCGSECGWTDGNGCSRAYDDLCFIRFADDPFEAMSHYLP